MVALFTSESVSAGHPDKLCDAISDSIVDACLKIDSGARIAVETLVKGMPEHALIVLAGEVTIDGDAPDYETIARETAVRIGYDNHAIGMDASSQELCLVDVNITTQSANIAQGVDGDSLDDVGAGDQGMMFGYACTETEAEEELSGRFFPLPAALSQRICRRLDMIVASGEIEWIRPDGKSQVTVEYDDEGNPLRVHTVVVAVQHDDALKDRFDGDIEAEQSYIREIIKKEVVEHAIPDYWLKQGYILHVNGTGRFADPGGPYADAGITGRKIVVDTYGGMARHGGGALVAYVIGVAAPVSLRVETFGTGTISEEELTERVSRVFDFRPAAISRELNLRRPLYSVTSAGGHFGRPPTDEGYFEWERIDQNRITALQSD